MGIQPNAVYTLAEVCEILKISDATMRRWVKEGKVRSAQVGRGYRFMGSQILEALSTPEPEAAAPEPAPRRRSSRAKTAS